MALMSTTSQGKDLRGCLVTIRATRGSLRVAERKVADYVLAHPGDVIHSSVSDVAQASGASEATVVRFCRALGYRGFPEMKTVLTRDLARQDGQLDASADLTTTDGADGVARHVFQNALQALGDTMELQQATALARAVDLLAAAPTILLCGVGGSAAVVRAAEHKFQLIDVRAVAHNDPQMLRVAAAGLDARDVAVGVSASGESPDVLAALTLAAENGAATIAITTRAGSALSRVAALALYTAGAEIDLGGHTVALHLSEMVLIDALFVAVALRRPRESTAMLERAERARTAEPEHR